MQFDQFMEMVLPALGGRCEASYTRGHRALSVVPEENLRLALVRRLWDDGRCAPIPTFALVRELAHLCKSGERPGECNAARRSRLVENLNKVRRTINEELEKTGCPCHIDLVFRSGSRDLIDCSGFQLVVGSEEVYLLRERDRLRRVAREGNGYRSVMVGLLGSTAPLKTGQTLRLSLRSRMTGYLSLFAFFHGGTCQLVPYDALTPVKIVARRIYSLPDDIYRTLAWPLEGAGGRHDVVALITKTCQPIAVAHAAEARTNLQRGIAVRTTSIWRLPRREVAIGFLSFAVTGTV